MAKTELTKEIEQAIVEWNPAQIGDIKVNKFRAHHTGLEVPAECGTTTGGIIDAVRVSEYFGNVKLRHICRMGRWKAQTGSDLQCPDGKNIAAGDEPECEHYGCRWNGTRKEGTPQVLITCIEIKVTKSDFKSEHGHNFVGNMNYYAVPEEIYKDIEPLVPEGIGILVYLHKGMYVGLRSRRKPTFRTMTDEEQKWLILSVFKRVRDMDFARYQKWLQRAKTPPEWLP